MNNKIFGEMIYHTGWEMKTRIPFNSIQKEIIVHAKAHGTDDEITSEQEKAFSIFIKDIDKIMKEIEQALLRDSGQDYVDRFTPVMLLIKKDGRCALLFDDEEDIENGLAVEFVSGIKIMTQDEFL